MPASAGLGVGTWADYFRRTHSAQPKPAENCEETGGCVPPPGGAGAGEGSATASPFAAPDPWAPVSAHFADLGELSPADRAEVHYRVTYAGYLAREERQIARLVDIEKIKLPLDLDYATVRGLRAESRAKLAAARPVTLGQASRISGVSPADISVLMVWCARR